MIEIKEPLIRIIEEGFEHTCCKKCGSTQRRRFYFFGKIIGCIQPECENYYDKRVTIRSILFRCRSRLQHFLNKMNSSNIADDIQLNSAINDDIDKIVKKWMRK
jgi:hypothetical protein